MRRVTTEFVGTFFLVLTVTCTVRGGASLAPLAIGAVLTALVFAGGHVSGAHYNPAVTLAVLLRGGIAAREVPGYVTAQLLAALGAGSLGRFLVPTATGAPLSLTGNRLVAALVAEALLTAALAYVVLNVATSSDHSGNHFYGLGIGFTVLAGAVAVGPVSGGAFNPAVAVGICTAGLVPWSLVWVYLVADLLGAAAAAGVFRVLNPHEWTAAPAAVAAVPAPRPPEPASARDAVV